MSDKYIPIYSIVKLTGWSDGLQQSMTGDFVSSNYANTAPLMGKTEADTSKNIQKKIYGFAEGKNTYLQANQLATIIHQFSSSVPRKRYPKRTTTASMPSGDLLKDCSGWSISKKTLPYGRIVYNAKIKAETPKNRGDWATIKGEIYTDTFFKWGRFGAFERWGEIENEEAVIEKLCEILGKYYEGGNEPTPKPEKNPTPEPETKKQFYYGQKYNIPKTNSDSLLLALRDRGFTIKALAETGILIWKDDPEVDSLIIGDTGAQFSIEKFGKDGFEFVANIPYRRMGGAIDAKSLAQTITDLWEETFDKDEDFPETKPIPETPTPEAPKKSKEDIEKAIKGLQFLADKGNEKAKKAIIGLKILLNK